jgi:hypothetical protein
MLMLTVALAYLPFLFFGYGSDGDTANVLNTVQSLIVNHTYLMSRVPGHVPQEIGATLLTLIGGSVLSNAGSLLMALLALYSFLRICRYFRIPHAKLLFLLFAFQPILWAHATYTIDYVWALAFLLLGFDLVLEERLFWGSIVWGLAVGTRLPFLLIVCSFMAWFFVQKKLSPKQFLQSAVIIAVTSVILFLPPFLSSGSNFSFLIVFNNSLKFDLVGWVGRFVYKNIYFWGLQTLLAFAIIFPWVIRGIKRKRMEFQGLLLLLLFVGFATELSFLSMPTKRPFLLPMLPFVLIVLGIALSDHRKLLLALFVVQLTYAVIDFNVAQPDIPGHATSAEVGFWIEPGYLMTEMESRVFSDIPRKP